jgi:hypothetical protein
LSAEKGDAAAVLSQVAFRFLHIGKPMVHYLERCLHRHLHGVVNVRYNAARRGLGSIGTV